MSPCVKFITSPSSPAIEDSPSPGEATLTDRVCTTIPAGGAALPVGAAHPSSAHGEDRQVTALAAAASLLTPEDAPKCLPPSGCGDEPLIEHDCHPLVAGRKASRGPGPCWSLRHLHVLECHQGNC